MSTLGSPRRYYLAKRHAAKAIGDKGLSLVWQQKQEAEPGTTLAASFPYASRLSAAGYTTKEDLEGADTRELYEQGFSTTEATYILAAVLEI